MAEFKDEPIEEPQAQEPEPEDTGEESGGESEEEPTHGDLADFAGADGPPPSSPADNDPTVKATPEQDSPPDE